MYVTIMYMYVTLRTFHLQCKMSQRRLINAHSPNLEIATATNLYFDGTRTHAVVERSFATFGDS